MRVLVYVGNLEIGGAQWAAVDVARGLAARGHEVRLASRPGPLAEQAAAAGVELVLGDHEPPHPSWRAARFVDRAAEDFSADLIHAVGGSAALEAATLAGARRGRPVVTDYPGDRLPPIVPRTAPVLAGMPHVLGDARARGIRTHAMFTPVDTDWNHPGIDGSAFRAGHAPPGGALIVVVSRLASYQKLPGLEGSVAMAGLLAERPVRLVIVGDGDQRSMLEARAATANRQAQAEVVRLVGPMLDPRPAYAAADVVLGLATSVLRGMAIARPAVILGRDGTSVVAEPANLEVLDRHGWVAPRSGGSPEELARQVSQLLDDPARARELGTWGRGAVVRTRSLSAYAERLEQAVYPDVLGRTRRTRTIFDAARCWSRWGVALALDRARRARRRAASARRSTWPGGGGR